jgi:hypothetical protein
MYTSVSRHTHLSPIIIFAMQRTQIYLDKELKQQLKTQAKLKNISLSEFIRQSLRKQLEAASECKLSGKEALLKLADSAPHLGETDLSQHVDDYLKDI